MTREPDTDRAADHNAASDRAATGDAAMDRCQLNAQPSSFMAGVITGGLIGAALALVFAPRAGADLRRNVAASAGELGSAVSNRRQDAAAHVGHAVGPFFHRETASIVAVDAASAAHDVAQSADSAKS